MHHGAWIKSPPFSTKGHDAVVRFAYHSQETDIEKQLHVEVHYEPKAGAAAGGKAHWHRLEPPKEIMKLTKTLTLGYEV